jgi:hypothetical protein
MVSDNIDREDAELGAAMRANYERMIGENIDREDAELGAAMRANMAAAEQAAAAAAPPPAARSIEIDNETPIWTDTGEPVNDAARAVRNNPYLIQVRSLDEEGAYVRSVRLAIANPPVGYSNTAATADLIARYGDSFRYLVSQGIGTTIFGADRQDRFYDNSFSVTPYPEESINNAADRTYHRYGVLTYLGPVDQANGITKDFVVNDVLRGMYSFPGYEVTPVAANFSGRSNVYAVGPFSAWWSDAALDNPRNYTYQIGSIEQAPVPDGVVNITTTDHDVYPGTIRRTVIEVDGQLFMYTSGAGLNRFRNTSWAPEFIQQRGGSANDYWGPMAFRALDRQVVRHLNRLR